MRLLATSVALLALTGCTYLQRGVARSSEVEPVAGFVVDRHDAYVDADESLDSSQRLALKTDSGQLMVLIRRGEVVELDALAARQAGVIDRHDAYVSADESLSETKRARYLRSTEIMRAMVDAGGVDR